MGINKKQKLLEIIGSSLIAVGISPIYAPLVGGWYFNGFQEESVYSSIKELEQFVKEGGKKISKTILRILD